MVVLSEACATEPTRMLALVHLGATSLAAAVATLGAGPLAST